ncbi:helix-turn-helix domain-containing protein [Streptomyces sp. NPDC058657]|uniref:helix-turn-helix domain-containing protein n=1 Tax=unclassified Streptomyces TaxID=2593676 RepID=UPI0036683547
MTGQRSDRRAAARKLGEALRSLQQQSGRTLRSLEAQVRISDSSLSRYFRGQTVPSWPVVRDLCRALDADPSAYRALWEAADPARSDDPAAPDHPARPEVSAAPDHPARPDDPARPAHLARADDPARPGEPAPAGAGSGADVPSPLSTSPRLALWRRPREGGLPYGRRAAFAAVLTLVAGALVTGLLLRTFQAEPGTGPTQGAEAAATAGHAGVLVHNVEKKCQEPRTNSCALSLAYNPYRPYVTSNSADRVWHHDLLQARCTVANGVAVTDENHKHTSIWVQVTHHGKRLWLPGIRIHPDHLYQLTAVLPTCTP